MRAHLGTYPAEFYYRFLRPHKCRTHNYVSTSAENGPAMAGPAGPVPAPMHCFTQYSTPVIRVTQHSVYNESKMSTYPCYIPPQTPACTFDALTSSPSIFYETLMHPATHSGSPHNALHSPSNIIHDQMLPCD